MKPSVLFSIFLSLLALSGGLLADITHYYSVFDQNHVYRWNLNWTLSGIVSKNNQIVSNGNLNPIDGRRIARTGKIRGTIVPAKMGIFNHYVPDIEAPQPFEILSTPANQGLQNPGQFRWNWTSPADSKSRIEQSEILVQKNNGAWERWEKLGDPVALNFTQSISDPGFYYIKVRAMDGWNNVQETTPAFPPLVIASLSGLTSFSKFIETHSVSLYQIPGFETSVSASSLPGAAKPATEIFLTRSSDLFSFTTTAPQPVPEQPVPVILTIPYTGTSPNQIPHYYDAASNRMLPYPENHYQIDPVQKHILLMVPNTAASTRVAVYQKLDTLAPKVSQWTIDGREALGIKPGSFVNNPPEIKFSLDDQFGIDSFQVKVLSKKTGKVEKLVTHSYQVVYPVLSTNGIKKSDSFSIFSKSSQTQQLANQSAELLPDGEYVVQILTRDIAGNLQTLESPVFSVTAQNVFTDFIVGPSPWNPNSTALQIYFNMSSSAEVRIRIFSIAGELLWQHNGTYNGANKIAWDGKTRYAESLGNGLYLCTIATHTSDGQTHVKKFHFTVLR